MSRIRGFSDPGRPLAALLAGALLLAACTASPVAPSALAGDAVTSPSDSISPSPSASASVAPEPSQAPSPLTIAWEESVAFDGQPTELIVDGDNWVAVGWATEGGPAAWTSLDARRWERAVVIDPQPDDLFLGSGLGPTVRLGDSLLSYGTFIGCCDGRGVLGWRSTDGRSWEVIESASPLFEEGYLVTGLAVGDPALVAIELRFGAFSGRLWRWTEETSWIEVTPGTADTDQQSGIQFQDVVWADGRFVVVGTRGDSAGAGPVTGTSWTSIDGETWEESTPTPEFAEVALAQVAAMPGGEFVALGFDSANSGSNGGPVAFTSPDGLAWTPSEAPSAESNTGPTEIIAVDGGLVAFGSDTTGTLVWSSADGQSWTDAGRLDHGFVAAAARGDQLVVLTVDHASGAAHAIHLGTLDR